MDSTAPLSVVVVQQESKQARKHASTHMDIVHLLGRSDSEGGE